MLGHLEMKAQTNVKIVKPADMPQATIQNAWKYQLNAIMEQLEMVHSDSASSAKMVSLLHIRMYLVIKINLNANMER